MPDLLTPALLLFGIPVSHGPVHPSAIFAALPAGPGPNPLQLGGDQADQRGDHAAAELEHRAL
jgi:hypothetical protein